MLSNTNIGIRRLLWSPSIALMLAPFTLYAQTKTADLPADFVIRNATVMTASHGTIERGSVWVHQGKIAGIGVTVSAPADATVIDATGKFLTLASSTRTPTPPWAMM